MVKHCNCGKQLGERNKSGRCQSCVGREMCIRNNANPAVKAKALATIANWTPEQRHAKAKHLRAHYHNMSEEERERRRQWGHRLAEGVLQRPDVVAKRTAPETRAKAGQAKTDSALAWCPPELRDTYRTLMQKHMTAVEARAYVEELIPGTEAHAKRAVANARDAMRIKRERDIAQSY